MASVNQNFTKWEGDTFIIQFTINDAEEDLSNYQAYWACSPITSSLAPSYVDGNSPKAIVKTTSGDYSSEGGISYQATDKFRVSITKNDTLDIAADTGSFYHELTLAKNGGSDSVVVSSGTFTMLFPIFPVGNR